MFHHAIYSRLSTSENLADLVGDRIYPTIPTEQTDPPFIVYTPSAGMRLATLSGVSGLRQGSLTVDVVALTFAEATNIADYVTARLHGWSDRPTVQGCFLQEQTSEPQDDYYQITQTYTVWHS